LTALKVGKTRIAFLFGPKSRQHRILLATLLAVPVNDCIVVALILVAATPVVDVAKVVSFGSASMIRRSKNDFPANIGSNK
jgi:hypothetical protein